MVRRWGVDVPDQKDLAAEAGAILEDRKAFNWNLRVLKEAFRLRSEDTAWTVKQRTQEYLSLVLARGGRWALEYCLRAMELNALTIQNQFRALRKGGAPTPETSVRLYLKLGSYSRPAKTHETSPAKPDSGLKTSGN